jgi:energy-coupling factor transport system substrate-specific component
MRRSYLCLTLILFIGVVSFALPAFPSCPLNVLINPALLATALVILAIAAFFFEFEERAASSKEIALISMLATISAVLRVPFAALPNIQPCTFLIICSGYAFGPVAGFMVGAITPLVSNFFLGHGPWTPYQMLAWGLCGVSAAYLRRFNPGRNMLALFGIIWGYLFGWIMNIFYWTAYVYPLTFTTFMVTQLSSLWLDTFSAVGNLIFLGLFGRKTIAILERFRKRFAWRMLEG